MKHYENKILKRLAFRIHRKFHMVIYGKLPNHNADYYDAYVAYFDRRLNEIEKAVKKTERIIKGFVSEQETLNTKKPPIKHKR